MAAVEKKRAYVKYVVDLLRGVANTTFFVGIDALLIATVSITIPLPKTKVVKATWSNRRMYRFFISVIVVTLAACVNHGGGAVGYWKTDPRPTQLGMTVDELCLRSDGSYVANAITQAGTLRSRGRYELENDTLRLIDDQKRVSVEAIELHGDVLIAHEREGYKPLILRYRRQPGRC